MMTAIPVRFQEASDLAFELDLQELYRSQRQPLIRLAWLLLHDASEAEEVVQDAFVKAHFAMGRRLSDPEKGAAYMRSIVLNGARSRLRHLRVVERHSRPSPTSWPAADVAALAHLEHASVLAALATLPRRQHECLVLRYYLDLSQDEIADALGISAGSVKTHIHRGLAALSTRLEDLR